MEPKKRADFVAGAGLVGAALLACVPCCAAFLVPVLASVGLAGVATWIGVTAPAVEVYAFAIAGGLVVAVVAVFVLARWRQSQPNAGCACPVACARSDSGSH